MNIIEVSDKETRRNFLELPLKLYEGNKVWIRPLDKDITNVFDRGKNKTWRNGEATRWILTANSGEVVGRIAAFVNNRTMNEGNKQPTGGIGFFDCIDNQEAANLLFETAKEWLSNKDMEAMDGPINFGDRNAWWGLLVDGFDLEPNYQCNYNPPYYQKLFEEYGFNTYFKQFTFARKIKDPLDPRLLAKAEKIMANPDYAFEHVEKKEIAKNAENFRNVYNAAWGGHSGVAEMSQSQALTLFKKMDAIVDEKIIWYVFYKNQPIGFYVNIPEINQVFKYVNGKMNLLGKLKFLYHQWRETNHKMLGIVFGIAPEHQGIGVDGALIHAVRKMVQEDYQRYSLLELNWIGDFNPKMVRVVEQVGGTVSKTHHTYRKLFNENVTFERMPING